MMKPCREKRDYSAIVLLDKPLGMTSNRALQITKRLFSAKKAGHGGCLDPLATGLLPIYFGQATKFSSYALNAEKRYRVTAKLGEMTSTGDAEGELIQQRAVPVLTTAQLQEACTTFTGNMLQVPPMYSALKHQGQPLYRLARQGVTVERPPRSITIFSLDFVSFSSPELTLDVHCSKGTYIRTLVEDLGHFLGCGAHVVQLRRTAVGPFSLQESVTLDACRVCRDEQQWKKLDAFGLPIDRTLTHLPQHHLSQLDAIRLQQGQSVAVSSDVPFDQVLRLYHAQDMRFIGLGEVLTEKQLTPKRMMSSPI